MRQNGIVGISVLLLLALVIAGGAYYLGRVSTKSQPQPTKTQQPAQIIPSPDLTANWKTYINKEKKYSLKYPSEIFLQLICPDEEKTNFYLSERKGWDEFKTQDSVNMPTCARGGRYDIEMTTPHLPPDPKRNQYYQYYSVESKDVSVGGVPAGMYVYNPIKEIPDTEGLLPPWGIDVLLTRDEVNYVFSLSDEKWTSIFEMILATVKFTSE